MIEHDEAAFRYLQRAEEVRAIAATMKDLECRRLMLSLAFDYEHIADTLRKVVATERRIKARHPL